MVFLLGSTTMSLNRYSQSQVGDVVPGVRPGHDGVMAPHDKGAHLGDEIHVDAALIVKPPAVYMVPWCEREVRWCGSGYENWATFSKRLRLPTCCEAR